MGEIDIASIEFETNNRDEIPQLLRGLQYIYCNEQLRSTVFNLLWDIIPESVNADNGRSGMDLWRILVLGTLRLNCNWDYDKLQEIANNHVKLRQMLGHGFLDFDTKYRRQTLNDNLRWLTEDVLKKINILVNDAGKKLLDKTDRDETDHARCDSFVVETNVHFPTDINLLWDSTRKAMQLSERVAELLHLQGWRQTRHNLKKVKRQFRAVQIERDRDKESKACHHATQQYIDTAIVFLNNAASIAEQIKPHVLYGGLGEEIERFVTHGKKQIDQIVRRCFKGEKIPHEEKVFSVFQEHTEWIEKGKAGVPQELGLRVCIVENRAGFIMNYRIMQQETDDRVAVPVIEETLKNFPQLKSCSFDKGFHSPDNQNKLSELLGECVLPKKGKLTDSDKKREWSESFKEKRRKHSAVESAINALENHGLGICRDDGLIGFKRYIAVAILARNIQLIGSILWRRELDMQMKKAA